MKIKRKVIAASLSAVMLASSAVSASVINVSGATAKPSISYTFDGANKDRAGFAEGHIEFKPTDHDGGNYFFYWADNTKALSGYYPVHSENPEPDKIVFDFVPQTAIPANATKLIVIHSDTEDKPDSTKVSDAVAVYNIPKEKQFPYSKSIMRYSFASYSDIHLSDDKSYYHNDSSGYLYDEQHLNAALKTAYDRNVDFIVTNGDNISNSEGSYYTKEWQRFRELLAGSDYCKPIYEEIGNHEVWGKVDVTSRAFIKATGLDSNNDTIKAEKSYYTFDEPITGDHFIMMGLEGGFYTNKVEEFSEEQMNWLEGLLKKYKDDGKTTYIYEHADFNGWGAGDDMEDQYYDIPLTLAKESHVKLQQLLCEYTDVIFFSGHTHLYFADQFNYVDNVAGTPTAKMMHNSSVGGIRRGNNAKSPHMKKENRKNILEDTEGYIMENYGDLLIANGTNLYYNLANPKTTYIVDCNNNPAKEKGIRPQVGDINKDGSINTADATVLAKSVAKKLTLTDEQKKYADINGDGKTDDKDRLALQRIMTGRHTDNKNTETDKTNVINNAINNAKATLDNSLLYSSYDQYMALKNHYIYLKKHKKDITPTALAYRVQLVKNETKNLTEAIRTFEATE